MISSRTFTAFICGWSLLVTTVGLTAQNQTPGRPQTQGRAGAGQPGNQTPAAPGNQTAARPTEPPPVAGTPLYISPGIVKLIQEKLVAQGYPMPTVSGTWGDNSAAGLAQFQRKQGLDPGGDLDELTLGALGLSSVLTGDVPPGGDTPVNASAAASGGGRLSASPRLTRVVQNKLTQAGFPTHNVFGIWITDIDNSPRNFQKAKGLDITNTLDLQLIHFLGLTDSLTVPKPGKLDTDSVAQILSGPAVLMTGAPISISTFGVRQIQTALQQRGFKEIAPDGKWSDATSAALKKFQEAQKLEPTGSVNLRTLRALGFNNPLAELDQPTRPAK
jgi:peptidoglycan hydrolase-like protein with peptidoglycan-binding domain